VLEKKHSAKSSLSSVLFLTLGKGRVLAKDTRQRNSLPSDKNKTLGKELLRRVFSFTEGFLRGTRQRASLPSARKKHSAKNMALDKEPNSSSLPSARKKHSAKNMALGKEPNSGSA
jgi:hypothetical protein